MKSLTKIEDEINAIITDKYPGLTPEEKVKAKKNNRTRIVFLNRCKKYIESGVEEEFLDSEIKRIENRISKIDKLFEQSSWFILDRPGINKKNKIEYMKENDVPALMNSLTALRFLK